MHWIDPDSLPETRGTVTAFLLNPHGELDGLILDNTKQVHFPPISPELSQSTSRLAPKYGSAD